MRHSRVVAIVFGVAAFAAPPGVAMADDAAFALPDAGADTRDPAFRYTTPASPDYLRAAAENALILGLGYLQYRLDNSNQQDFALPATFGSLGVKLEGEHTTFDDNYLATNWVTHPLAGFAYYSAARSNRLSVPVSFAYAAASAALWEYVGEIREEVSINDLIVTPLTGVPLGEAFMQIGVLAQRSKRSVGGTAAGWVFAPLKSVHDWIDGVEPERADEFDDLGIAADVWHRFRIAGEVGVTAQDHGLTQGDGRIRGSSRIVALDVYGRPGDGHRWFSSGEVSSLAVSTTTSEGRLVDFFFGASTTPFGYHWRSIDETHRGNEILAGLQIAAEYGTHDYDRDGRRPTDRIALVGLGPSLEITHHGGPWLLRGGFDVLGNFAGVDAYALPEYSERFGDAHLSGVMRKRRYYNGVGLTARPVIMLEVGALDLGGDVRGDIFGSIDVADVDPAPDGNRIRSSDQRLIARSWIGVSPTPHLRLSIVAERRERAGWVGSQHASRGESSLYGGVELVF